MLVLTRHRDEQIVLDFTDIAPEDLDELRSKPITIEVIAFQGGPNQVRVSVHRREIYNEIQREREAAAARAAAAGGEP
jgi:sRNA-binding carbon storage regulator CsrA